MIKNSHYIAQAEKCNPQHKVTFQYKTMMSETAQKQKIK